MTTDKRYRTRRWRELRLRVLVRDLWRCQVAPNCAVPADVADHIQPVYPGMPDADFFDPANLRASCKRHNTARGVAARLQRDMEGQSEVASRSRYSYGTRFFSVRPEQERRLANLSPHSRNSPLAAATRRKAAVS